MSLSNADEKVIKKIKEGARKVYPEQVYVEPALIPGFFITFICGIFLLLHLMTPEIDGPLPFDIALLGTSIGICTLVPGIIVWLHLKNAYSFLGFRRFQVALSITALELSNLGHKKVEAIISPTYPAEYQYLPLFMVTGPGNLLSRMEGVQWDSETIEAMLRQSKRFSVSMSGLVGGLSLIVSLIMFPVFFFIFPLVGFAALFIHILWLFLFTMGVVLVPYARHKLHALEEEESTAGAPSDQSSLPETLSAKCSVEDALSIIRQGYPHPIRMLVVGLYSVLEYTERSYYTGDGIELQEAYLMPAGQMN